MLCIISVPQNILMSKVCVKWMACFEYLSCMTYVPHDSGKEIEDEHATKILGQLLSLITWHEFDSNIVVDWHIPCKQHLSMHIISIH